MLRRIPGQTHYDLHQIVAYLSPPGGAITFYRLHLFAVSAGAKMYAGQAIDLDYNRWSPQIFPAVLSSSFMTDSISSRRILQFPETNFNYFFSLSMSDSSIF